MLSNERFVSKAPEDKSTGRKRKTGKIHTDAGTGSGTSGRIKAIEYTVI